jgi:DNA-directed RNA polymerase subunit delta
MSKKRAIISYDKLTIEQKKQILKDFPDGYINHLTTIKTPTGDILDAFVWETEEVIYLVKINKIIPKAAVVDDEDDDFEDDLDKVDDIKDDELDDDADDEDDDFDAPDEEPEDEDED